MATLHQFGAQRRHQVRLARTRIAKDAHVGCVRQEMPLAQRRQMPSHGCGQARQVQCFQCLAERQPGLLGQPGHAPVGPLEHLDRGQFRQVAQRIPALLAGLGRQALAMRLERRQAQLLQVPWQRPQFRPRHDDSLRPASNWS